MGALPGLKMFGRRLNRWGQLWELACKQPSAFSEGSMGTSAACRTRMADGGRWGMEIYGSKGVVTIRMTTVPQVFWWPERFLGTQ